MRPSLLEFSITVRNLLLAVTTLVIVFGPAWPWLKKLGLGSLPGDFTYTGLSHTFYVPFTTMLVLGLVVMLVIWIFRR